MRSRLASLAVAILLSGCLTLGSDDGNEPPTSDHARSPRDADWSLTDCEFGTGDADLPPLLAVLTPEREESSTIGEEGPGRRLVRMELRNGGFVETASSEWTVVAPTFYAADAPFAQVGEHVFAYARPPGGGNASLVRLDATLRVTAETPFGTVGAMATDGRVLYVAGEDLVAYDRDLNELGRVPLPLKEAGWGKLAHDALVAGGVAYLVDDVVMPLFILRVDVSDLASMSVIDRERMDTVGGHLPGHWIDRDRWMVLQSFGQRGGGGLNVHAFPVGSGEAVALAAHRIEYNHTDGGRTSETGYHISAITHESPAWAFVTNATTRAFGRLDVDVAGSRFDFCRHALPFALELGGSGPTRSGVARSGNLVVAHWNDHVAVLEETAGLPTLLHAGSIPGAETVRAWT